MDVRYGVWKRAPKSAGTVPTASRIEWVPGVLVSADANTCNVLVADKETGAISSHHISNVVIIT